MKKHLIFRLIRKLFRKDTYTEEYVEIFNQDANDYVLKRLIDEDGGLMISKFGTIELDNLICYEKNQAGLCLNDYINGIKGEYSIHIDESFEKLCSNAGFFPQNSILLEKYTDLVKEDMKCIDILGSYIVSEKYIEKMLSSKCKKINIEGYYAPFLWENPWTQYLEDKKVLVVHPFADSIRKQYEKRETLFENKKVLPKFKKLYVIKAVQSIAGNGVNTGYGDWFDALNDMKKQMDSYDYDVAIIGCGAYGMHLAAHAKRCGKKAVHMAGWTQMLFGIYGNRWIKDQPKFSTYINDQWIRPGENERPLGSEKVENGCYW